ncbi:MAG TPA: hypothetical protein VM120_20095 [Bryobacteraceae bacterium]|nr:hypothetical protein [Bryobacteraceae bacterium]
MRNTLICTLSFLLAVQAASAETLVTSHPQQKQGRGRFWKISVAVLAAATTVDAASSWGHTEANPFLRGVDGRFGYKALSLKAAILGGTLGAQYFLMKRNPKSEKYTAFTNLALSGVFAGAAVSNYRRSARATAFNAPSPK